MSSDTCRRRWQFMSTSRPSESHMIADVPLSEQTCPSSELSQRNPLLVSNHTSKSLEREAHMPSCIARLNKSARPISGGWSALFPYVGNFRVARHPTGTGPDEATTPSFPKSGHLGQSRPGRQSFSAQPKEQASLGWVRPPIQNSELSSASSH